MSKKFRVTITMDEKVFKDFQRVLPSYSSVSGVIDLFIREYMAGYYKFDWSIGEMFDVLRGKTTVTYLQKVHELSLKGAPDYIIGSALAEHVYMEELEESAAVDSVTNSAVVTKNTIGKKLKTRKKI